MDYKKRTKQYLCKTLLISVVSLIVFFLIVKSIPLMLPDTNEFSTIIFMLFFFIVQINFTFDLLKTMKEVAYIPRKALVVELTEKSATVLFDCSSKNKINDGTLDKLALPENVKKGDALLFLKNQTKWIIDDIQLD